MPTSLQRKTSRTVEATVRSPELQSVDLSQAATLSSAVTAQKDRFGERSDRLNVRGMMRGSDYFAKITNTINTQGSAPKTITATANTESSSSIRDNQPPMAESIARHRA
jgi:hypothetical protein